MTSSNVTPQFVRRTRAPIPPDPLPSFRDAPREIESYRAGYPRLGAFLDSDKNFTVFRRFGQLHARILLYKQDELIELEQQLNQLDAQEPMPFYLRSRRKDHNPQRKTLIDEIELKLEKYDAMVQTYYSYLERPPPTERNLDSVSNWFEGNKPLASEESSILSDWNDLITPVNDVDDYGMNRFIENAADFLKTYRVSKLIAVERDRLKSRDPNVSFETVSRVSTISRFITTFLAISSLMVPIIVLYYVNSTPARLWVITGFTTIFSIVLSHWTKSRNYEIFSATAAYCAVMVVFVGNIPS